MTCERFLVALVSDLLKNLFGSCSLDMFHVSFHLEPSQQHATPRQSQTKSNNRPASQPFHWNLTIHLPAYIQIAQPDLLLVPAPSAPSSGRTLSALPGKGIISRQPLFRSCCLLSRSPHPPRLAIPDGHAALEMSESVGATFMSQVGTTLGQTHPRALCA